MWLIKPNIFKEILGRAKIKVSPVILVFKLRKRRSVRSELSVSNRIVVAWWNRKLWWWFQASSLLIDFSCLYLGWYNQIKTIQRFIINQPYFQDWAKFGLQVRRQLFPSCLNHQGRKLESTFFLHHFSYRSHCRAYLAMQSKNTCSDFDFNLFKWFHLKCK